MSRDYRERKVNGWLSDGKHMGMFPVVVRMTSDNKGQSLSLTAGTIQIGIPLEAIEDIVKVVDRGLYHERT